MNKRILQKIKTKKNLRNFGETGRKKTRLRAFARTRAKKLDVMCVCPRISSLFIDQF